MSAPRAPRVPRVPRVPRERRERRERGAATAELAMVLPMLVALTVALVWFQALGAAQVRAVDAARETARALARGDSEADALARGRRVAPAAATVAVATTGDEVTVTVTARFAGPGGLLGSFPTPTVRASAVAALEAQP